MRDATYKLMPTLELTDKARKEMREYVDSEVGASTGGDTGDGGGTGSGGSDDTGVTE